MKRLLVLISVLHCLSMSTAAAQTTSHDFYKGKAVRIVVGNSVGGAMDDWARFIALYLGKHIPGNPDILVQNMPGAASIIAANHVYNVGKPDGLTLGLINPAIYIDQLLGAKEVKYDWSKFAWIGSPEKIDQVLYVRTDSPYKTLEEIRRAAEPPRCASLGRTGLGYFLPKLLEEGLGLKINIVAGYGGGGEMNMAIEKGEVHCRAGTASAYVSREPTRTWIKNGFIRALTQSGATRYAKLADVPTIHELLEAHKAADATRRVARVILASGDLGRPFVAHPGTPFDRVKVLRAAFSKTMTDPELLAEAKKRGWDIDLLGGEELEKLAKEIMRQPPEVIERVKKMLGS
jgi:tripartite-type tricarboxylate transporter receptor subunit TctC